MLTDNILQLHPLQVVPDPLIKVQLGSVGWQPLQMDSLPSRAGQEGFDRLAPVDGAAIPDDQQPHRDVGGHWEGDTIVGDGHRTGIHTEVKRISRLVFAYKVPKIRAKETSAVQLWLFSRLPKLARKSTTLDNGSEHYLHTRLQDELGMQTYFADPYSSWQRGTNEYTNGLLRRYFPKRTNFRDVSQEALNDVVHRLNNIPRKVLHYKTPSEVFTEQLSQLFNAA
jgi:IS30 family transposase